MLRSSAPPRGSFLDLVQIGSEETLSSLPASDGACQCELRAQPSLPPPDGDPHTAQRGNERKTVPEWAPQNPRPWGSDNAKRIHALILFDMMIFSKSSRRWN